MPACLTNEPADECSARVADIDRERQRVDLNLRQLQESEC
jgi:ribosomal protein S1